MGNAAGRAQVLLTDFGLARDMATGSRFTRTGTTLGTLTYMSPEQARGEVSTLTPATDAWALGCVLHEALCGRPPFQADTPQALVGAILAEPARPTAALPPDAPAAVAAVLDRSLAKAPAQRYPSAGALRDDLDRVRAGRRPRARARLRWRVVVLGGAAVLATAAAVGGALGGGPPTPAGAGSPGMGAELLAAHARAQRTADPTRAARALEQALTLTPGRHDWRLELGLLWWAAGDLAQADGAWRAIPLQAPEGPRATLWRGLAEFFCEREGYLGGTEAAPVLEAAAAGSGPEARIAAAVQHVRARRWGDARAGLHAVAGWEAALLRGYVEAKAPDGDRAVAVRELTYARAEGIPMAWASACRGWACMQLGDTAAALQGFDEALRLDPHNSMARRNRSALRARTGDLAGARADLDWLVAAHPDHPGGWADRAHLRVQTGEPDGAAADAAQAVARGTESAPALWIHGLARLRAGDHAGALAALTAALPQLDASSRVPSRIDVLVPLTEAQSMTRDWAATVRSCDELLAALPENASVRGLRGQARRLVGDAEGAFEDLSRVATDPKHGPPALLQRAMIHRDRGDGAAALADLRAARDGGLASPELWSWLATFCVRQGALAEALPALRAYLALEPQGVWAAEARQLLARCEAALPPAAGG